MAILVLVEVRVPRHGLEHQGPEEEQEEGERKAVVPEEAFGRETEALVTCTLAPAATPPSGSPSVRIASSQGPLASSSSVLGSPSASSAQAAPPWRCWIAAWNASAVAVASGPRSVAPHPATATHPSATTS